MPWVPLEIQADLGSKAGSVSLPCASCLGIFDFLLPSNKIISVVAYLQDFSTEMFIKFISGLKITEDLVNLFFSGGYIAIEHLHHKNHHWIEFNKIKIFTSCHISQNDTDHTWPKTMTTSVDIHSADENKCIQM